MNNLPERIYGRDLGYQLAVSEGLLAHNIFEATNINVITGDLISHVMRGLREKIDKLIVGLKVCIFFALSDQLQQNIYDSIQTNWVIFFSVAPRLDKCPTKSGTLLPQKKFSVQRKFHVAKNLSLCYHSRQSCGCAT